MTKREPWLWLRRQRDAPDYARCWQVRSEGKTVQDDNLDKWEFRVLFTDGTWRERAFSK